MKTIIAVEWDVLKQIYFLLCMALWWYVVPQLSTIHGGCLMSSEFELTRLVGYSKAETENEIRRVADSLGTAPASNTRGC